MDRFDLQSLRAYAPSIALCGAGLLALYVLAGWVDKPVLAAFAQTFKWPAFAAVVAGLGHCTWVTWRLWRAEQGVGLLCRCGGLLGAERDGRASRGGRYRRCLACGTNVNHRHYE